MLIGQPIDRRDGRQKITGGARYAAEFSPPGVVHAVLVQSTIGAGSVTGFDLEAARDMPGVLAIITTGNALKLPGLANKPNGQKQTSSHIVSAPLLQNGELYYNGQHVAVAVADTLDRAIAAAEAVRPQYQQGEAVTDMAAVLDQAYPPRDFRNGTRPPDSRRGDPDGAFASARRARGCDVRDAARAPQPDGAARDRRSLAGRPAHGLDGDASDQWRAGVDGDAVRHPA